MLERIWKARKDQRGFTLIELIMVLVILGILLALALPSYLGTRKRAYLSEADQQLQEIRTQAWLHFVERNTFSGFTIGNVSTPYWTYGVGNGNDTSIVMSASASAKAPLTGNERVVLTLSSDGSAVVTSSGF